MLKVTFSVIVLVSTSACLGAGGSTTKLSGSLVGCPNFTGISAQYAQSGPGLPVRCGPQRVAPVTYR